MTIAPEKNRKQPLPACTAEFTQIVQHYSVLEWKGNFG